MEWKRDPDTGMLTGPDGCDYDNEHQAAHFGLLGLCGCGDPVSAYNFCRDVLSACDRRGKGEWKDAQEEITRLIASDPEIAAHVLMHLLSDRDLLEHGGSVGGSWLTDQGSAIVDLPPATEEALFTR